MNLNHSRSRDISRGFPGILVSASDFSNHFIPLIRSTPKGTESSPRIHIRCHVGRMKVACCVDESVGLTAEVFTD